MKLHFLRACEALLAVVVGLENPIWAQQPQTDSTPTPGDNASYLQGVGTGYRPSYSGSGMRLNLDRGTAFCGDPPVPVFYGTGGYLDLSFTTNYVYLDPAYSLDPCRPWFDTAPFKAGQVPIAKVCTDLTNFVACSTGEPLVKDLRNWFVPQPCVMNSSGAVNCAALGSAQNVTLTPSTTGSVSITGGKLTADGALSLTAGGTGDKDITLTPNGTGNVLVPRLNKIRFASQFQGADLGAKINAASSDAGPNALIYVDTPGLISTTLSLAAGTVLQFYPGGYHWQIGSTVYANDVKIRGAGPSATQFLVDSAAMDLLTINGNRFELSGVQVMPASGVTRGGGSVLNVGTGSQGLVANCRFTDMGNGVTRTTPGADLWTFRDIRADSSGGKWNYLFYFSGSATTTLAGTYLDNITVDFRQSNNGTGPSDSVLIIDGGVDTLEAVHLEAMTHNHPAITVENTIQGSVNPRWIRFVNTYLETAMNADGVSISATTDFRYQGLIASSQRGALIGANAVGVDLSHTIFENISREAVKIESGAVGTTLADDTFENTGIEATTAGTQDQASLDRDASSNVTASLSAHGLSVGDYIVVSGCVHDTTYNGGPTSTGGTAFKVATVPDANSFTYNQGTGGLSSTSGCTVQKTALYNSVLVVGGAAGFSIRGNKFRDLVAGKPRYNVNIASGASTAFEVTENQFGAPAIGYLNNGATGASWTVLGNSPASGTLLDVAGSAGRFQVSSSGAVLAFTRNNANYIQAATTGGWLDFVVNGRTVGDVNASLKLAPNGDAYFPLGKVGIGTTSPGAQLDVLGGSIRTDTQLVSTTATGTAPLSVASTTKVANLNADLVGGVQLTNTPSANQVPVAASGTHAAWNTLLLASGQFANQGTTTTVLHGNASGNPSWASVVANDVDKTSFGTLTWGNNADFTWSFDDSAASSPSIAFAAGGITISAAGTDQNITLTPSGNGRILLQSGISPSSSGLKHARASTSSIAAGSDSAVTVNWASAFADASYTVSCSVYDATPSNASLKVVHTECIAAGSVSVRVRNDAANALTGTVHCIALHD